MKRLAPALTPMIALLALVSLRCGASDSGDGASNDAGVAPADARRDAHPSGSKPDGSVSPGDDAPSGDDDDSGAGDDDAGLGTTDSAVPPDASPTADKIVAGYFPNWTPSPVRIRDVDSHYNLIYLFVATPVGGAPGTTGAITWDAPGDGRGAATHLKEDIAYARTVQHRKIILSVGGQGGGMSFPNRTKSTTFVSSVVSIYTQLGGFDGLDWNTFEGNQSPDTSEMIWISLELKSRYPGFLITAPPAPWNNVDKTFCSQMVSAGALDYAAPQYYDGPNLATKSYIESSVTEWVNLLGEEHVVVGFGIWDQANYMSIDDAVPTWKSVKASHPNVRGAFDWQIHFDESQGWVFAKRIGPLVAP